MENSKPKIPDDVTIYANTALATDNELPSNQPDSFSKNILQAWEKTKDQLRQELDEQIFHGYISPIHFGFVDVESGILTLRGPSRFIIGQVEKNFSTKISNILSSILKAEFLINFVIAEEAPQERNQRYMVVKKFPVSSNSEQNLSNQPNISPAKNSTSVELPNGVSEVSSASIADSQLNNRYHFENFVVGNSNQFCHAASLRVAERPGQSYNPLFIYGGVGLGKTHLLHAIGNEVLRRDPKKKVLYLSAEAFTNELILALRHAKMDEFKKKLRTIEVLLIDDIQFISGKERTQEEFFHTFNTLYGAKHQIVLTSDKMPSEIHGIEERLQTRFSWGLTADIQAPDFETRVAILKRKAESESFIIPEEVAHFIADQISSNVRELEGALTRLHAVCSLRNVKISLDVAKNALSPILVGKPIQLTVEDIKVQVAEQFRLKVSDIVSKRRTRNLSFPRHIAMYLCRKHTTASYPEIGEQFGGRDHSSVIHAAHVVATKLPNDPQLKEVIEIIERRLFSRDS
jgi:chromosomal replication initiator protein